MEKYVPLHNHSVYSIMDAVSTPEQLVEKAFQKGHKAIALTDHGVMGGLMNLQNAALAKGIKPILGMEGYVVNNLAKFDEKEKRIREKNNHIILLAKNEKGYKSILRLNYLSNSDDTHFYYKPRFSFNELWENHEGIIVGSACLASGFSNLLKRNKEEDAEKLFQKFIEVFKEDFYAEVQLNEITDSDGISQKSYNDWLIYQATKNGVPIVITGDVHYAEKEGAITQEFSFHLRDDDDKEVGERFLCHHLFYHEINDFIEFDKVFHYNYGEEKIRGWCNNSCVIADRINYIIPERTKTFLPRQAFDEDDELVKQAKEGLVKHFNVQNYSECPKEYRDRIEYELSMMIKKGIARYILCLKDIVEWCDNNDIPRGSSRGCFLPDNVVNLIDNNKKISEVKEKEKIFSGFGIKTFIEKIFSYFIDEDITEITVGGKKIKSTQDHKILVVRKGLPLKIENAEWIEASKIISGDYMIKNL